MASGAERWRQGEKGGAKRRKVASGGERWRQEEKGGVRGGQVASGGVGGITLHCRVQSTEYSVKCKYCRVHSAKCRVQSRLQSKEYGVG